MSARSTDDLLADLAVFPPKDRAAWRAKVAKALDGADPDEALARPGEDGARRLPVYTEEDRPSTPAAPTTWRNGALVNLVTVHAETASTWEALVERELAAGATGVASPVLPQGCVAVAEELLDRGIALVLGTLPPGSLGGPWVLADDPLNPPTSKSDARLDDALVRQIELGAARTSRTGSGRRAGCVRLQHYANAGATPAQELGLLVASLAEYARRVDALGTAPAEFLPGLAIQIDLTTDVFTSIAKLRAARVLWSKVLAAHGVAGDPPPWIVARTGHRTWSALDPETNWIRATCQGVAAFLGGADAFVALPHDRALAGDDSSATALRTARDLSSVLGLEGHLGRVEDPARGSYYLEAETDRLARAGWEFAATLERQGGLLRALAIGSVAAALATSKVERRARLAAGDAALVGVTRYRRAEDGPVPEPSPGSTSGPWDLAREAAPWEVRP